MTDRILILACVLGVAAPAAAWDPFLTPNEEVEDGNERMSADDAESALRHYDQAARRLPNEAGVHLNRGLALLESGELEAALEAFETASEPSALRELRADAYYDAGLAHYRLGDAAANEDDHQEAQRLFRDASDAFRRSLRMRPGNAHAGWNLELSLRRIREQEEQQQQEDEENQDQDQDQDQDQEPQDQDQDQDQEPQDQDPQDQDQDQDQDQEPQDQDQDQDQEPQDQDPQDQDQSSDDEESSEGDDSEDGESSPENQPPPSREEDAPDGTQESSLPPEHRRVLDALRDSEENLQRHRARARGDRERRRVERDW